MSTFGDTQMDDRKFEGKLWDHLEADRTVMLGLADDPVGHSRPMTAMLDKQTPGVIWFFTSADNVLAQQAAAPVVAFCAFASKGHDLFATISGTLQTGLDRDVVDRLWNSFIAAWYPGGKDDPKLILLRFDPEEAEIWLNEHSLVAGLKVLLGRDPKKDYEDKVAKVDL